MSDSGEMGNATLQKTKDDLIGVTGQSRKSYYQQEESEDGSSSAAEEDMLEAVKQAQRAKEKRIALRLQKQAEEEESSEEVMKPEYDDEEDSSSDEQDSNLGDKLFDSDNEEKKVHEYGTMDAKLVNKIVTADAPELRGLILEFKEALDTATKQYKPLIEKI